MHLVMEEYAFQLALAALGPARPPQHDLAHLGRQAGRAPVHNVSA